ncbi:MAG: TIGR03000 domain-containing protein, partial [Rubripirellula sp.]
QLNVPADAVVTLAGNATRGDGSVRTYRTSQLKDGQVWSGYTVRVTAEIDGKPVSEERTIDLVAGSTNELFFDFGLSKVASR